MSTATIRAAGGRAGGTGAVAGVLGAETTEERIGDWIQVYSGGAFWPLDPRPEEVRIEDIAHALSNQCRFSGHVRRFYSVAQHSIHVTELCPPEHRLAALLHDAPEAYVIDLPRPIKQLPELHPYRVAELKVWEAVVLRFGLQLILPARVVEADHIMLASEVRDLMTPCERVWGKWVREIVPREAPVNPWGPARAESTFLALFRHLYGGG
jgi:uncharacterized protein